MCHQISCKHILLFLKVQSVIPLVLSNHEDTHTQRIPSQTLHHVPIQLKEPKRGLIVTHRSEMESSSLLPLFPQLTPKRLPQRPWEVIGMQLPEDLRTVWDEYAAFADFTAIENVEGKQCRVVHMHQGGRDWTIQSPKCICLTKDLPDSTPTYVHRSKDGEMVCQACYEYVNVQRFLDSFYHFF